MEIEQANAFPLARIFDKLGYQSLQHKNYEILYQSPFSQREGDYLRLYPKLNIWFDDHLNKRGNSIAFVMAYLRYMGHHHMPKDALRWIEIMAGSYPSIQPISFEENTQEQPGATVKKIEKISHRGIINYLKDNGIPDKLASRHLKQVKVYIPSQRKSVLALGLQNEDHGWEVFNPNHRLIIGIRNIYYIRGHIPKPSAIHIFANIFDYYSAVIQKGRNLKFDDAALILNSFTLLPKATPYLRPYGFDRAYTWMPNDKYGQLAKESLDKFFSLEPVIKHIPKNNLYANHLDANSWHCARIEKMAST